MLHVVSELGAIHARRRHIVGIGERIAVRDGRKEHLDAHEKVLDAVGHVFDGVRRPAVFLADDVPVDERRDDHGLPEGEEDDQLDAEELGQRADGLELLVHGVIKQDEAVQRRHLADVDGDGDVHVGPVGRQLAVVVLARMLRDECHACAERLHDGVLQHADLVAPHKVAVVHAPGGQAAAGDHVLVGLQLHDAR